MAKTLQGGAVVNYGSALPAGNIAYDGYLFYKNTGLDAGLYVYSYKQDIDATTNAFGQAQVHEWNPIATTELFVSKLGDTMSGKLVITGTNTGTAYGAGEYALGLVNLSNTAGARSGAIQWRYAGATSAVAAQIDIINGTGNASSQLAFGTRGPSGSITERVRIDETGLITSGGKKYWNEDNDGSGSGLDADLLDGLDSSYFRNATNLNAGTIAEARLPFQPVQQGGGTGQSTSKVYIGWATATNTLNLQVGTTNYANTWPISITGNAATANTANSAASATNATNATNSQYQWYNASTSSGRLQFNSTASATSPTYVLGVASISSGTGTTTAQHYNTANLSVGASETANRLASARTINTVPFDGTANITIADATKLPLIGGSLTGSLTILSGTESNNFGSGALVVQGGIGVGRSINSGGNITATGSIASTSDIRVKTDIRKIENAGARVAKLSGNTYDRTDIKTSRQAGVIAQEVLDVLPEAVLIDADGKLAVNYNAVVALLVEAVKELQAEVKLLKQQS